MGGHSEKGFTLVELVVVLIIIGVVLGIGVPKYFKVQAQAEYDADVANNKKIGQGSRNVRG